MDTILIRTPFDSMFYYFSSVKNVRNYEIFYKILKNIFCETTSSSKNHTQKLSILALGLTGRCKSGLLMIGPKVGQIGLQ